MIADGVTPRQPKFETEKELLRQSIRSALSAAASFEDFSARLMQDYGIEVRESRGRLSYLTPDRAKPITARKLGTDYDKAAVLTVLTENASKATKKEQAGQNHRDSVIERLKCHKTSKITPNQDSVQCMVDIPAKMGEGKGK